MTQIMLNRWPERPQWPNAFESRFFYQLFCGIEVRDDTILHWMKDTNTVRCIGLNLQCADACGNRLISLHRNYGRDIGDDLVLIDNGCPDRTDIDGNVLCLLEKIECAHCCMFVSFFVALIE